jgi:hypothetical protein
MHLAKVWKVYYVSGPVLSTGDSSVKKATILPHAEMGVSVTAQKAGLLVEGRK